VCRRAFVDGSSLHPGPLVLRQAPIRPSDFFRMEVVAPKDAGQRLWQKVFTSVFPEQVDQIFRISV
jgi:hypothetical protein